MHIIERHIRPTPQEASPSDVRPSDVMRRVPLQSALHAEEDGRRWGRGLWGCYGGMVMELLDDVDGDRLVREMAGSDSASTRDMLMGE